MNTTDKEWEKWGARDPYYGVLSLDEFRKSKIDEATRNAFFQSGQDYVAQVFSKMRTQIDPEFQPRKILDFGCGVGRLVVAFAQRASDVTGIDVSESMLAEARKNCAIKHIGNVELIRSQDDGLSVLENRQFDLVHSYIVFQHIPVIRGERIFRALLARLTEGGYGILHFPYANGTSNQFSATQKTKAWLRKHLSIVDWLICLRRDLAGADPEMEMNAYDLNVLFRTLQALGVKRIFIEFAKHGDLFGVIVFFQKPSQPPH